MRSAIVLLFFFLTCARCAEKVAFPSGATLEAAEEVYLYEDALKTGSKLFKVGAEGVKDSKRLTLNIDVGSFRDSNYVFFRAHPVFMLCVQRAWNEVQNANRKIVLKQGYKLTTGSKAQDLYSRAGTGVRLAFDSSESTKSYSSIVTALLRHCPPLFAPLGRDLGVIIESDAIFAFMKGPLQPSPLTVTAQGSNPDFASITDLPKWVRSQINAVTQPKVVPKCGVDVPELNIGQSLPSGPISFVGPADRSARRVDFLPGSLDFLRLVQFPSDNLAFKPCPAGGELGSSVSMRCGPRLMAPRLFLCLNKLQRMVRADLGLELKVTEGWRDVGAGAKADLRSEGREAAVGLRSGSNTELGKVARLAVCAGCDWVRRDASSVRVAVLKQYDADTAPVVFPSAQLLPVAAPAESWEDLKLPAKFDQSDFPLFDGALDRNVSEGVPLSLFRSKETDVRYLRLHPAMVKCFTEIVRWENRLQPKSATKIGLKVVQGFMSKSQEQSLMSPLIDDRLDTNTRGIGLQLSYDKTDKGLDVWRLARSIAAVCPLVFKMQEDNVVAGRAIGLGIYAESVHVDMRHVGKIWFECEEGCEKMRAPEKDFRSDLETLIKNSANNRLVDPSDREVSCKFDNPPSLQSPSYSYKESEAVRRTRRSVGTSANCQLGAPPNAFCQQSLAARNAEVSKMWNIISAKHLVVSKTKVLAALNGCFLSCSECAAGPVWDAKLRDCDNLVHWVPFGTLNMDAAVRSNLYPRSDTEAAKRACEEGEHCLDLSPLFGIFIDSLQARFRPVPSKPNTELVYDPVGNPSPVPVLMQKIFAFSARGEVKVWLKSEADVTAMASSLKVLFLYNKHVTKIRILALDSGALSVIVAALEGQLELWRTSGCPETSRVALTPYEAEAAPASGSGGAYKERHRLRALWEKWYSAEERPDFL